MATDQKQDPNEETYGSELFEETPEESRGEARSGPQPFKRHTAGKWADQVARLVLADVSTSRSMFQHRYGLTHVSLIQKVLPEHDVATPRLLSLVEVVEGGPRADEVDLGEHTKNNNENVQKYKV